MTESLSDADYRGAGHAGDTAYTLGYVQAGNTSQLECAMCENRLAPPCYVVLTCPTGTVHMLCERCIAVGADMILTDQEKRQ